MTANFSVETTLWNQGSRYIAGIDEVGRGPWAGPVVAAAVIFPPFPHLPKLPNDSKTLSEVQRYALKQIIEEHALDIGIGEVSPLEIDTNGIVPSTFRAMEQAISSLSLNPDYYLVDAFEIPHIESNTQRAIVKGDALSASIAAASIIAKIHRDELMKELANDSQYSAYGFEKHKGYGTKVHKEAILQHGLTDQHRKTFIHFL